MKSSTKKIIGALILVVLVVYIMKFRTPAAAAAVAAPAGAAPGGWTVYGSKACGWTRKQLESMDSKKMDYKFVDCDKEDCGDISSFPTIKSASGALSVGFNANL
jgi:hypothetical protein